MSHTFSKNKVWKTNFRVGRLEIDVHTYKSMQNLKYGDGRDLFPMVWKGFLYNLSHPLGDPSFKGVPDDILHDY